ncbi:hypothetical protein [Streptacidiphilus fuscans]|jgi:hypothetical protein|uniref:Formate-dependent nitrite reductase complex subunit NrfF n=1 Tax=Streptacidiphilus fuscans TaxID=2789292 RepID=A0A931B420_9ACTN|nr:hypothetical protein [Streptacidiphilus fuscans]MBF9068292.1 hypothetical protein [Streptacidiphilus fuscans]
MERTVVRCAEGHLFSTASFPMQHLRDGRIGPGRLMRCPQCARLRSAVPADLAALSTEQISKALRREAMEFLA